MKVMFAGPSLSKDLSRLQREASSIVLAPPAEWGDVARATLRGATAIGLVDGLFENTRSVWHKEILFAIASGVAVAGAASMGALRAAECATFGMVGIGVVFHRYASGDLVDDADVAQIHAPAEFGYLPISEPWVNVEPTLVKMVSAGVISSCEHQLLHERARSIPFKWRTYKKILEPLNQPPGRSDSLLEWLRLNAVDQKRLDALELVDWLISKRHEPSLSRDWMFSETSHWKAVYDELLLEDLPFPRPVEVFPS
jgi:hypothetical protein